MPKRLKTIAVDLMPLLPGGDNGGAKIFVLGLLKKLAIIAPDTTFILLTSDEAYPELQSLVSGNIQCLPITTPGSSIRRGGGYLSRLPLPKFLSVLGYRVYRYLRKRSGAESLTTVQADLLFCPFTTATYDFNPPIPTVCVIYDLQHKTYPQFFSTPVCLHRDLVFKEACERATAIAVISEYSRQSVLKNSTFPPEKVKTIYLQMGERFETVSSKEKENGFRILAETLQLTAEKYLIYPANYWSHKNHERLIDAFVMAYKKLPTDFRLVFTGAQSERQNVLKDYVKQRKIQGSIVFAGYLTNHELASLLSRSAGVIFPSLYEGYGLPVIEAMTAGIPVACSNVTALPEIVENAAILFDPNKVEAIAEAIERLISNPQLREALIEKGIRRAGDFSNTTRMAEEYWELFQEVVCAATA